MDLEIDGFGEGTDIDKNGKFYRFKKARFKVNGEEHTLRISMPDFQAGKSRTLIENEARKIDAVFAVKTK